MYEELKAWRDTYGTTLVPKQASRSLPLASGCCAQQGRLQVMAEPCAACGSLTACDSRSAHGGTQVFDNVALGAWVHRVRKQGREGRLPPAQMAKLDELLFVWKVDEQSAKWHYTLHEARRFKVFCCLCTNSGGT